MLHDAMRRADATTGKARGWIRLARASTRDQDCAHCDATNAANVLNRVTAGQAAKHTAIQGAAKNTTERQLVGILATLFFATVAWRWARPS